MRLVTATCAAVCELSAHLFVRYAVANVLQVSADVVHLGVAEEDAGEVLLADGGHAFGVGEELDLEHLRLQVVHESGGGARDGTVTGNATTCGSLTKDHLTWSLTPPPCI